MHDASEFFSGLAASDARPAVVARIAVVCPYDTVSVRAAAEARTRYGVETLLVGDGRRIAAALAAAELRADDDMLVDVEGDDGVVAAAAVALVRGGAANVLMKGAIHSDDFLRAAVDRTAGLRQAGRVMSHVFVCVPPREIYHKALLVTDAAFNVAPDLAAKREIARNAIRLARALGIVTPKVAVLAAVESVNPAMVATTDAAALAVMAQRGQLGDAIVEGPLAFDNALSRAAAQAKGLDSAVAGDPDILLVPDIEAGNILYKQMVYFSRALAAGIVLGASAPLVLTSRAEPLAARVASCALAAALLNTAALDAQVANA
ncbi:MAG: hypothetical protein NVSMB19_13840 [Vulcanimicrobiaceae bacterium]